MTPFLMAAAAIGLVLVSAIADRRAAVVIAVVALVALWTQFQGTAGTPATADNRLAAEEFRVLSISQIAPDDFLVSVRYAGGDVRSYVLALPTQAEKDKFLKAQQSLKRGINLTGRAAHPRTGLENDGGMDFGFTTQEPPPKP